MRPVRRGDNTAILVVPNVKVKMEAQHPILPLNLHDLLWASFYMRKNYLTVQNGQI